jgi:hypothetical protein
LLEQAVPGGVYRSGCARPKVQLGEDAVDVPVDGVSAQDELGSDLLVAQALRHETEDICLPPGQAGQIGCHTGSLAELGLYFTQHGGCGLGVRNRAELLEDGKCCAGFRFGDLKVEFT